MIQESPEHNGSNRAPTGHDPQRAGGRRFWRIGLLTLVALAAVVFGATLMKGADSPPEQLSPKVTHTVSRGDLAVTVTEQGTLESSRNTEIKCTIRGGYGGRGGDSTVTWVIPAGTVVKKGDELVRLDTKIIEETISLGKTDTNIAKANLARAKADLATAEIAIDGYLKGRFTSEMKALEGRFVVAKRNLLASQELLRKTKSLFKRGYVTNLEVEANGYSVKQAELILKVVETEKDVLGRLTKAMELETLNGQLTATQARLKGRQAGLELEQGRLDLAQIELENCSIKAPQNGLVIYPSTAKWKDAPDVTKGASIHNNQVLLLMPDLSQMQVKVGIHESIVDRVKKGMPARVTMPGKTLQTEVSLVAPVARPAGWWTGNLVKYDTILRLPSMPGLNPGMTAEVELEIARYEDVLTVPAAAVLQTEVGFTCWVETADGNERRVLRIGDSNDESIVVEQGLSEGEQVILNPLESLKEARDMVRSVQVHTVRRGDLLETLTEQGALESSDNTLIKCRVRGSSTVNWLIENGTQVNQGDELLRLENKKIEDFLHERTKFAHLSRDAAIGFRADATRAGLAISEYLEGRFLTALMTLQKDLAVAESRLRTTKDMQRHAQMMFSRGYVSELDVDQKEVEVRKALADVGIKKTEIDVLKRFTKEEQLATLRGNWEAAKAAAKGHEEVLAMDEARMDLAREEIERCVIKAPKSGLVIYPNTAHWKGTPDVAEGATVHNDQVLLLMPDLSRMQVKFGIHESMVERVKPGMTAKVTLPDKTLEGKVTKVASAAQPAGWWTGNIVKYDAIIELPSVKGLKPGMSAEVEVQMGRHEDVLMIPVEAILETEEGHFCWVGTPQKAERRLIQVGDSNNEFMIVTDGLQEGEQVVLNPVSYFDDARDLTEALPRLSESK